MNKDFDLLVSGAETEGCLAACVAAHLGAKVALLFPGDHLGGLLTSGGLSYVDRDSRHLQHPFDSPEDGIFGEFLRRSGVKMVSLDPARGEKTLREMLEKEGVFCLKGEVQSAKIEHHFLSSIRLKDGNRLSSKFFLDATQDGDLAELAGISFATGFREYGIPRFLGVSPLPQVEGVTPRRIYETCLRLSMDPNLEDLKRKFFGDRRFNQLELGTDYLLIGPPHLGLAYQKWREEKNYPFPHAFEADGFNVAILGPETTSWNGLIYFSEDPKTLLHWSRSGIDGVFYQEAKIFEGFLREGLGWKEAVVKLPDSLYVRQTRHALGTRRRLSLGEILRNEGIERTGSFCYYPDFRGFRSLSLPYPLVAPIPLSTGLFEKIPNLGIASRAGGYTPFAHSLCRLVQFNANLGAALGVSAAFAERDLSEVPVEEIRKALQHLKILSDDREGAERNLEVLSALAKDPMFALEGG